MNRLFFFSLLLFSSMAYSQPTDNANSRGEPIRKVTYLLQKSRMGNEIPVYQGWPESDRYLIVPYPLTPELYHNKHYRDSLLNTQYIHLTKAIKGGYSAIKILVYKKGSIFGRQRTYYIQDLLLY